MSEIKARVDQESPEKVGELFGVLTATSDMMREYRFVGQRIFGSDFIGLVTSLEQFHSALYGKVKKESKNED